MANQTKQTPDDIKAAFVDLAFDEAYRIREVLYGSHDEEGNEVSPGVFDRRKANREQLRGLASQGFLTPEQREELNELYPARARKREEQEEANAAAGSEPEPANA